MKKICILFFFITSILFSQERRQPRVGLVLSGGGAKGFAHIGALKELEKAGVQIDYIGGTSMGSIIAALYATGYKPNEIETIIKKIDFNKLLQDQVPRRQKPYFQKKYLEKKTITLPINKGFIGLPMGLSKGQNVLNLFTELLAPVDEITDFSKLPIPFYCIGTNIETGEQLVFENGSLPLAVRASASFPSLLNPVEIDGKLSVDGGVVNNFPVDIMEKKDVDIIIGVNVQGKLLKQGELTSIASVLAQIINFQMYKKSDSQIDKVDVYIRPRTADYQVISFDKADEIIDEGVKASKPFKAVFDSIAKFQKNKNRIPRVIKNTGSFIVDRIVIKGNKDYTKSYFLNKMQLKEGDTISYKMISKKINTLTATKNFEKIDYNFSKSFHGKKLELIVKENKMKSFLGLGLHYDLLYKSGVLLNYNHKKILFRNDELSFDVVVGDRIRYNLEYFLDDGPFGYGFSSRYNSFSSNILFNANASINKIDIEYRDFTNRLYAQTTLDKKFALGFGIEHKNLRAKSDTFLTNDEETYFDDTNYYIGLAFLQLDTFDKKQFPTHGFYADINFKWYLASDRDNGLNRFYTQSPFIQFSQIDAKIGFATTFWSNLTLEYTSEAGYTLGKEETGVFDFRLGGYNKNFINNFFPMYGYDVAELTEQSFLRSELDLRYQIFNKNYLSFIANYARIENNIFEGGLFNNIKSGYAIGYGLETIIGPIEFKYSWSPDHGKNYWLFNLGFWF